MIVNTPRGPKPRTETSGASPAPAAGTAPANPTHPPANSNPKKPPGVAFSAKLGSLPGAAAKLAEVKIAPLAETPPTSLAPPTEAATPRAINAANTAAPATNGSETSANTPAPDPAPAPAPAAASPPHAPSAPEATPGLTPDPSGTNPAAQAPPPEAEEPPPATSQSGSSAAQTKPPPSEKPVVAPATTAPDDEEDEHDPHRREKELVAAGVRLALGDAGVRQALLASFGGEVGRLLDRELKPIREAVSALQATGTLKGHLEAKLTEMKEAFATDILAKLGPAATPEQVSRLFEDAIGRINERVQDMGKMVNDHTDIAAGGVKTAAEIQISALAGQVDRAKQAAEQVSANVLGVGGTLSQIEQRAGEMVTATNSLADSADRVADQLAAVGPTARATPILPPAAVPATNPGAPVPTALGGGIGASPVVGAGPAGQPVVAAGNPIPTPPPAGPRALHGPARDYQNVKVLVGGIIAIVGLLLAIIFL